VLAGADAARARAPTNSPPDAEPRGDGAPADAGPAPADLRPPLDAAPTDRAPATPDLPAPADAAIDARPIAAPGSDDHPYWPDLGDGRYRNPIIVADYSDPDVLRVGEDFYMTASSFNATPGLPILHSRDLVGWTIVGHALVNVPGRRYEQPLHGQGVYAPAIREHAGTFFITFPVYCRPADNGACAEEGVWVTTGQWHANHQDAWASLDARPGHFRLFPQGAPGASWRGRRTSSCRSCRRGRSASTRRSSCRGRQAPRARAFSFGVSPRWR
jgi:hypothetical protein